MKKLRIFFYILGVFFKYLLQLDLVFYKESSKPINIPLNTYIAYELKTYEVFLNSNIIKSWINLYIMRFESCCGTEHQWQIIFRTYTLCTHLVNMKDSFLLQLMRNRPFFTPEAHRDFSSNKWINEKPVPKQGILIYAYLIWNILSKHFGDIVCDIHLKTPIPTSFLYKLTLKIHFAFGSFW